MPFQLKQLGQSRRTFTASINPEDLSGGVALAEYILGMSFLQNTTTAPTALTLLDAIDELVITKSGDSIIDFENGEDLYAFNVINDFDPSIPEIVIPAADNASAYVLGLSVPLNLPSANKGTYQHRVDANIPATVDTGKITIAEAWGQVDYSGLPHSLIQAKSFNIVKRLYTPAATGENQGVDISGNGDLIGILFFQTTYPATGNSGSDVVSIRQAWLRIGDQEVAHLDDLTHYSSSRQLPRGVTENAVTDKYFYWSFLRQPWNCRGKAVVLRTDAGTADAIRIYPIYLV